MRNGHVLEHTRDPNFVQRGAGFRSTVWAGRRSLRKMRVLLVDDSRAVRLHLRKVLLQSGVSNLEVHEASNGSDALALLHESKPDLILSDWIMPEMGGVDLLRELRSRHSSVQFGFVTERAASSQMCETGYEAGAQFFIERPLNMQRLMGILDELDSGT